VYSTYELGTLAGSLGATKLVTFLKEYRVLLCRRLLRVLFVTDVHGPVRVPKAGPILSLLLKYGGYFTICLKIGFIF
jgi:hypothetical protein